MHHVRLHLLLQRSSIRLLLRGDPAERAFTVDAYGGTEYGRNDARDAQRSELVLELHSNPRSFARFAPKRLCASTHHRDGNLIVGLRLPRLAVLLR
ncbi:MAG: hypothetical protein J0L65_01775 [Xanthomonadales bacterium]|jgi:hypothetical protein|nr:hypothetical protein [Xanthomonadales bacterium]